MQLPGLFERLSDRLTQADRAIVLKALSFGMVGVVNFAVDFTFFSFGYYVLHWPIVLANVVSWAIAVSGSYVMNSLITFAAESGRQLRFRDYVTFAGSQVGGLIANTATVWVLSSYLLPFLFGLSTPVAVLIGKICAVAASFLVNFSLSHWLVFRRHDNAIRH
jgi:putative flippase GtrA